MPPTDPAFAIRVRAVLEQHHPRYIGVDGHYCACGWRPSGTTDATRTVEWRHHLADVLIGEPAMPQDRMLQFFDYSHLPPKLQAVSSPFGDLATYIVATLPQNAERTVALRKLLEAKDAAVRAVLYAEEKS